MYLDHGGLPKAADALSGFPSDAKDSRMIELGTFEHRMAGGGIHMRFFCVDSVGHAAVLTKLRDDGCKDMGEPQSAALYIPVEAGAIDSFVLQARSIGTTVQRRTFTWLIPRWIGYEDGPRAPFHS